MLFSDIAAMNILS